MNFTSPEKVCTKVQHLIDADFTAAQNRALYIDLFNGAPPYTKAEADANHIQVNVNFREGQMILLNARQQFENAFLTTNNLFTAKIDGPPIHKKEAYSLEVTKQANRILKRSRPFLHTMREKLGSICLHGIGPQMWCNQYSPIPTYIGVEDMLVPRDTPITLEFLPYFAVRRKMSPKSLASKTFGVGKNVDPGWNLPVVRKLLDQYKDLNDNPNHYNWADDPEKMAEEYKQNSFYYLGDKAPVIWLWDFYYQMDDEPDSCYYKCIVLDQNSSIGISNIDDFKKEFVYKSDKPFADNLDRAAHIQFGDGNNKPPFMYHSVRSLGMLLFDVVHLMNRLRCQFTQKVFEDMMMLYRVQDPMDRSRLNEVTMGINQGVIPDGLKIVTKDERYMPDVNMIQTLMANYKQLMGESTSSYTRDINDNTAKERTAFEVNALLSQTAQLTGSMLNLAYRQEVFAYQEICRRLCLKNTPDFLAKKFQAACKTAGIPDKYMDVNRWDIEAERVLGAGNLQLQQAQARELLALSPSLAPDAQQKVKHDFVFAITQDPDRANSLAPLEGAPHVSDSIHDSELAFGSLMGGNPVTPKQGLNALEVCETILNLMQYKIQQIMQAGGVGTPQEVNGLSMAAQYVQAFIMQVGQDPQNQQKAKQYGDALGKMTNEIKAFKQRQDEIAKKQAEAQQNQQNQAEMQKMQMEAARTQQQMQTESATTAQTMRINQAEFMADQNRMNAETAAKIQREGVLAAAKAAATMQKAKKPSNGSQTAE